MTKRKIKKLKQKTTLKPKGHLYTKNKEIYTKKWNSKTNNYINMRSIKKAPM